MPDLRRSLRSVDLPGREDVTLRNAFRLTSIALFFGTAAMLVLVSITADIFLIALFTGVLLSQMLYVILPMDRIRGKARALWTGEAGEEAYEELEDRGGGLL